MVGKWNKIVYGHSEFSLRPLWVENSLWKNHKIVTFHYDFFFEWTFRFWVDVWSNQIHVFASNSNSAWETMNSNEPTERLEKTIYWRLFPGTRLATWLSVFITRSVLHWFIYSFARPFPIEFIFSLSTITPDHQQSLAVTRCVNWIPMLVFVLKHFHYPIITVLQINGKIMLYRINWSTLLSQIHKFFDNKSCFSFHSFPKGNAMTWHSCWYTGNISERFTI
jgi:hypothetical protein